MKDEILLGWEALEYEPRNNSADWYWAVGIITVALVVISILLDNILLGIVIGLGSLILTLYTKRTPRIIEIAITKKGIHHDEHIYLFENINSYHIDEETLSVPKLVLKSKKLVMPYTMIRLDSVSPEELKEILDQYIKEDDHPEPLFYKVLEKLGF